MKKYTLLLSALFTVSILLFSQFNSSLAENKPTDATSHEKFSNILKDNCFKCHGGKKTKGDLDLVSMLKKNIHLDDLDSWSKVFSEVQSGNMPPEDDEEPLTVDEKKEIISLLKETLGEANKTRSRRMITPDEYKNSIANLYQIDFKNYDPIGDLYTYVSPDHKFHTVNSNRMMNRFYFSAIMDGTERIIKEYTSNNKPLVGKSRDPNVKFKLNEKQKKRVELQKIKNATRKKQLLDAIKNASTEEEKRAAEKMFYDSLQGRLEREIARKTPKSVNYTSTFKYPMKMSPKIKDTTDGFFEYNADYWGIRGKSWIENNNMPIMLLGGYSQQFRIFPPGKYRLTIRASAIDRESISTVPETQSKETAWSNNNRLKTELCKLLVFKDAHRTKTKSDPLTRATPIGSFHIEDNKIKDYTLDVSFHWNTQLGVLFENGVVNVIKSGEHPIMYYDDNDKIVYVSPTRKLPTIRIYDVTIDKIEDVSMSNLYIKNMSSFDDNAAKKKIETFVALTYLKESSKYIDFYEGLRSNSGMSVFDSYVNTMKWMFMTSDYLYLDGNSDDFKDVLRYASYSLLKTIPNKEFAKSFKMYKSGTLSVKEFTDALVKNKDFEKFIISFSSQWMHFSEISQNTPDRVKYPAYYDDELKEDFQNETSSYIKYLFTDNRKLSELVESNYHFINDKLAVLYGIKDVKNYDVRKIEADDNNDRMGILSHASFMAANSNGVEDLPFRRSKWISENILDKMIPPPPNEVDVTAFGKAEKEDFASRIKAHISDDKCYECHKLLDPMAIDIHMYDVLGHFKKDEISPSIGKKHLENLKKKTTSSKRRIASAFTKNLITFINGRNLGINDLLIVNAVLDKTKKDGYRARDILEQLIANYFKPQK